MFLLALNSTKTTRYHELVFSRLIALLFVSICLQVIVDSPTAASDDFHHLSRWSRAAAGPQLVEHRVVKKPGKKITRRRKIIKKVANVPQATQTLMQQNRVPQPPKGTPPPVTKSPNVKELSIVHPTVSSNLTHARVAGKEISRQELENVLNIPGVKCGSVPIYKKLYSLSINESFQTNLSEDVEEGGNFRILHGLDSVVGEWPWIVKLSYCIDDTCWTCTGTLLNDRWVLTAGHCGHQRDVTKYKAFFGLYDLVTPEPTSFSLNLEKMIVHPEYKELMNDLTLMKLEKPVKFSDNVQPACLVRPIRNTIAFTKNRKCYTVGYGLGEEMNSVERLQKLQINFKEPSACNSAKMGQVKLRPNTVCIGPPEGKIGGSCKGDSGGPDLCYDPAGDRWELYGTVSYGPSICDRDSDDQWLTVSVELANYRTWILSTIAAN